MTRMSPATEAAQTQSTDRLRELAEHRAATVRRAVAGNAAVPDDVLATLVEDSDEGVRATAAGTATGRPQLHEALSLSKDRWVRAILAHTYAQLPTHGLARPMQERLVADDFHEVRQRIGETTSHLDLFELLLGDPDPKVRAGCGANPRLTREHMESLLTDRLASVRAGAVAGGVMYPDDAQLIRMAADRSVEVRWQVSIRPGAPREALTILLDDPDEMNSRHAQRALDGKLNSTHVVAFAGRERNAARGLSFGDAVAVAPVPPGR